ncbi:hypothetical protein LIPSTDRAFT_117584 [Lipomyces starkeyi NRRL Y-11557]|uniref:Uncharacterized protein n=1 Tax=Lipomyces starkeyi NRRL Y-11557 TaxID=675824 RepID=A0A1E3Q5N5_LIPST|nr:hypothetical protein LIPSTDRAFT_117584 [Lipomyces starkeyi NRRL Y-11557]
MVRNQKGTSIFRTIRTLLTISTHDLAKWCLLANVADTIPWYTASKRNTDIERQCPSPPRYLKGIRLA